MTNPTEQPESVAPSPLDRLLADPSLLIDPAGYFLYPTTDGIADWSSKSFSVFHSLDLLHWTEEGVILDVARDVGWASGHAWAPAAVERDGKYYLFFTADDSIGVAIADAPSGPFTDSGRPIVAAGAHPGRAIDPSVFVDDDGTHYLVWGNGVAHIAALADDMRSIDERTVQSWQPTGFREAAFIHKQGETYFLSWSVDDTRSPDYHVRYATAAHPFGPWTDRGVLLSKEPTRGVLGTGHHSISRIPDTDTWIITYHRFAIPGGNGFRREIVFAPLEHLRGQLLPVQHPRTPLTLPLGEGGPVGAGDALSSASA